MEFIILVLLGLVLLMLLGSVSRPSNNISSIHGKPERLGGDDLRRSLREAQEHNRGF